MIPDDLRHSRCDTARNAVAVIAAGICRTVVVVACTLIPTGLDKGTDGLAAFGSIIRGVAVLQCFPFGLEFILCGQYVGILLAAAFHSAHILDITLKPRLQIFRQSLAVITAVERITDNG